MKWSKNQFYIVELFLFLFYLEFFDSSTINFRGYLASSRFYWESLWKTGSMFWHVYVVNEDSFTSDPQAGILFIGLHKTTQTYTSISKAAPHINCLCLTNEYLEHKTNILTNKILVSEMK